MGLPVEPGPWKSSVSTVTTCSSRRSERSADRSTCLAGSGPTSSVSAATARTNIQDYESGQDSILLLRESGSVTTSVANAVTTVLVDSVPVVYLDGVWADSDLEVHFNLFL